MEVQKMIPVIPDVVCAVCGEPIAPAAEYYDYPGLGICICAKCAEDARIPGEYMSELEALFCAREVE